MELAIVPYLTEDGEADVHCAKVDGSKPARDKALEALEQFTARKDPGEIREHCSLWGATKVLVAEGPDGFIAYAIESILAEENPEEKAV